MTGLNESVFEESICEHLVSSAGYDSVKVGTANSDFDPQSGIDTVELFSVSGGDSGGTLE